MTLTKLKTNPQKSKCKNPSTNIILRECKDGFFGYTNTGDPCCFNKPKDIIVTQQGEVKQHIITTDKILNENRLGVLPTILENILSKKYLRLGIIQNKFSFLTAITKLIKPDYSTDKSIEFVLKSLNENIYTRLDGISQTFSYEEYKDYISNEWLNHKLVLELFSKLFQINIIVINIKKKNVSCINGFFNKSLRYIIILKNEKFYEPVITNKQNTFSKNDIKSVLELYKFSCKAIIPDNFPLTLRKIMKKVPNVKQVVNKAGKVNFVNYKQGMIPIKVSNPVDEINDGEYTKTIAKIQRDLLDSLKIDELKVISQIVYENKVVGLMVKSNVIVPVIKSDIMDDLDVLNMKYYDNINEVFQLNKAVPDKRIKTVLNRKINEEYFNRINFMMSEYLKKEKDDRELLKLIKKSKTTRSEKVKKMKSIIKLQVLKMVAKTKNENITIENKREVCSNITEQTSCNNYCIWESDKCKLVLLQTVDDIILHIIQNILKSDDILNGKIPMEIIDENDFIKRNTEIVLMEPQQVIEWLK